MKKIISLVLSVIMLFTLVLPASAAVKDYSDIPVITLHGLGSHISGRDGQEDYNGADKAAAVLSDETFLKELGQKLINAYLTDNWQEYADYLYEKMVPCFANTQLTDDGELYDNGTGNSSIYWSWTEASIPGAQSKYYSSDDFDYSIDWRLDPMEIGRDFGAYVNAVLKKTGASKVKILIRCMGSNVFFSCLAQDEAIFEKIDEVCFYMPAVQGIDLVGAIFSGNLSLDSTSVDRFLNNMLYNTAIDGELKDLITICVSVLDYIQLLGFTAEEINGIIDELRYIFIPRMVMSSFGTYPGFWSLVGEEYFDDAREFIFTHEDYGTKYAGIVEKIDNYDKNVRSQLTNLLDKADEHFTINVISKYNTPNIPVNEGCEITSDGFSCVGDTSFGATGGICYRALDEAYLETVMGTEREKYLSPDKMVDASTCRYPDTTWFIKDCVHGTFPENIYLLSDYMFANDVTVFSDTGLWSQYIGYDEQNNMMIPFEEDAETNEDTWSDSPFAVFIRFFTRIFNFISKLFKGEINLGELLGKE